MIRFWNTRSNTSDQIAVQLREQARAFDPDVPASVRRRVMDTVSNLPAPNRSRPHWPVAVGAMASLVIVAMLLWRAVPGSDVTPTASVPNPQANVTPPSHAAVAFGRPPSMVNLFVSEAFQTELDHLVTGFASAATTVTQILPAAAKRVQPMTRPASAVDRV